MQSILHALQNHVMTNIKEYTIDKEIENMFSMFLLSYRNTHKNLGELEKALEMLACGSCSHSISRSPKLPLVFL